MIEFVGAYSLPGKIMFRALFYTGTPVSLIKPESAWNVRHVQA